MHLAKRTDSRRRQRLQHFNDAVLGVVYVQANADKLVKRQVQHQHNDGCHKSYNDTRKIWT